MEAAKIEWERIESVFVEDDVYESINAPQWVDLLLLSPSPSHLYNDDVAWFCRPDCKHPTTAEDFLNSTPPSSPFKLLRSASVSKLIGLVDWTRRDPNFKRRGGGGVLPHSSTTTNGDSENQDPNFSSPSRQISYLNKAAIKSSAQKTQAQAQEDQHPHILLYSHSQSAKDLFGKITEFCNDFKKMTTHAKDDDHKLSASTPPLENRPKERLPLLDLVTAAKGTPPRKNKIRRVDEAENIPISLNLNNMKKLEEEKKVLPIRTNPPTPQGFSATRDPIKARASKSPKSRRMETEMIEEVGMKKRVKEEEDGETRNASILGSVEREGRTLDVFWLFKPCALSS